MKRFFDRLRGGTVPPDQTFPDDWARFLWDHYEHYRRLPRALRPPFEQGVQQFIATQRITGIEMEADDRLRLLVASSAATLSLGWRGYKWQEVSEVLLYPDSFDSNFTIGPQERAGTAHVWGTVILSVPALWQSFEYPDDAYHVGLHEFAHLLTYERGRYLTIPIGLQATQVREWEAIQAGELERIRRGDSVVEMLGVQSETEFFPSAVEAFFEKPMALGEKNRDLYQFLRRYFDQDPAAWQTDYQKQMEDR